MEMRGVVYSCGDVRFSAWVKLNEMELWESLVLKALLLTVRYQFTPIRIVAIKELTQTPTKTQKQTKMITSWRNWNPCALLVGMSMMQMLWKTVWKFHFWVWVQWSWKQGLKQIFVYPCSRQHYSQQTKSGNTPNAYWWLSGWWWRLQNSVNVVNATELYHLTWLKRYILC